MKVSSLLLFVAVLAVLSGCTGSGNISEVAKSIPEVQVFLQEFPDSEISVLSLSAEAVAKDSDFLAKCTGVEAGAYYKAVFLDPGTKLRAFVFLNSEKQVMCAYREPIKASEEKNETDDTNEKKYYDPETGKEVEEKEEEEKKQEAVEQETYNNISLLTEQITCVFSDAEKTKECWSDYGRCKSNSSCTVSVNGKEGTIIEWTSSCGGSKKTILNGIDKQVEFSCRTISTESTSGGTSSSNNTTNSGSSTSNNNTTNNSSSGSSDTNNEPPSAATIYTSCVDNDGLNYYTWSDTILTGGPAGTDRYIDFCETDNQLAEMYCIQLGSGSYDIGRQYVSCEKGCKYPGQCIS